jgi:hypothetical protein
MNLSVKLFINDEVRRFMFNGTTFHDLLESCSKLTPLPQGTVLQYYDDEGDYVTLSTDIELQYAVALLKQEPKILRVRVLMPLPESSMQQVTISPVFSQGSGNSYRTGEGEVAEWRRGGGRHYRHHQGQGWEDKHRRVKDLDARFVAHVNYEDGCKVSPGHSFVKTWALRNNGSSRWPEGTSIMRVDRNNELNAAYTTPFIGSVPVPGAEANVSVKLQAPNLTGEYTSYFKMLSPSGKKFGQRFRCVVVVVKDYAQPTTTTSTTPPPLSNN